MKNILLIEDDIQLNTLLKHKLEKEGYNVQSATDGFQAFQLYSKLPPDLIITDILMPEVDGLEFLLSIKQRYPNDHFKTIAMSGGGTIEGESYLHWMKSFGAEALLKKPFKLAELINTVNSLLGDDLIKSPRLQL